MPVAKIRVFLVDDHPIVRRGFQMLVNLEADVTICGEAGDAPAALQKIPAARPDVVVVDLGLKSSSGLELVRQLRVLHPKLKLLVFTMRNEGIYAERALRAGANGYLTKEEGTEKAVEAIRSIARGQSYLSEKVSAHIIGRVIGGGDPKSFSHESLSDRELEVLELLGKGLGSREIAGQLRVSIKTVESHREHLKTKLGLSRAPELVQYAFNWVHGEGSEG